MKITKEKFIEEYIALSIAQGEAYDAILTNEWKEMRKMNDQLAKKSVKYCDFLTEDIRFAKKTLDRLIEIDNIYVMKNVAFMLWNFNYKMDDCYKLFEKVISNNEKKHQPTVIAADAALLSIKENRLKRHREFPKID